MSFCYSAITSVRLKFNGKNLNNKNLNKKSVSGVYALQQNFQHRYVKDKRTY